MNYQTPIIVTQNPTVQTVQESADSPELSYFDKIEELVTRPLTRKLVAVGLTLQGLIGLLISLKFVLVDFPILETRLTQHSIQQAEVNNIAIEAILITISTILSMLFALKLGMTQNKAAKSINTLFGVFLLLGNAFILNTLRDLPLVESWGNFINDLLLLKNKLF